MKRKADQVEEEGVKDSNCNYNYYHNHGVSWWRGPLIGKGGFGSVYLANSKKPNSRNRVFPPVMAVKSAEVSVSASLQKEKLVFNNLQGCPYVIQCFGEETTFGKNGEMVYNVLLEYASGGTLSGLIKKSNACGCGLPELDVRIYTRSILEGIDFIHRSGYIHCDLKPENILLVSTKNTGTTGTRWVPKIGDFGLTKRVEKGKKRKFDPYFGGTPLYMAPETVVDHIQEPPSDIWALGCIVLEMLTGKPAWDLKPDVTTEELLRKIGDPYELPKIPTGISKYARDFLKACLVRKPMFRFTAEMLFNLPFVSRIDEDNCGEFKEISDAEEMDSSVISFESDDESCASSSANCSFAPQEGSPFLSWVDNGDESGSTTSSTIIVGDGHAIQSSGQVSLKTMQQCSPLFTIPAGA